MKGYVTLRQKIEMQENMSTQLPMANLSHEKGMGKFGFNVLFIQSIVKQVCTRLLMASLIMELMFELIIKHIHTAYSWLTYITDCTGTATSTTVNPLPPVLFLLPFLPGKLTKFAFLLNKLIISFYVWHKF